MHRFLPALTALALFSAGCGYMGDPLPPLANIPAAIADLAAVQRSDRIVVQFSLPTMTTEGIEIRSPLEVDLRAGTAAIQPFSAEAWAARATPMSPVPVENGHVRMELQASGWIGKEVTLGVRVAGSNGKESKWSNFVNVPVVPAPPIPASAEAKATAKGVLLTWQGAPGEFRVFRRAGKETDFTRVADVTEDHWTDPDSQFGTFYSYVIQRVVKVANGHEAESDLTPALTINPQDTFPPAAPTGLHAIPASGSIELSWENNTESDLAGYRIYRAVPGGNWERIAATGIPGFSDRNVEKGKTYRYAVSAVDQAGNESTRSSETGAALPQ